MNVFEELERLKAKGLTVFVTINTPDLKDDNADENVLFNTVLIGQKDDSDDDVFYCQCKGDETIEQLMYRAIIEFDEAHPEYL
jgi:hypothetical protein